MQTRVIKWVLTSILIVFISYMAYWFYVGSHLVQRVDHFFQQALPEKSFTITRTGFPFHWSLVVHPVDGPAPSLNNANEENAELMMIIKKIDQSISWNQPLRLNFSMGLHSLSIDYDVNIKKKTHSAGTLRWEMKRSLFFHLSSSETLLQEWLRHLDQFTGLVSIENTEYQLKTKKPWAFKLNPLNNKQWHYRLEGALDGDWQDAFAEFITKKKIHMPLASLEALWEKHPVDTHFQTNGTVLFSGDRSVSSLIDGYKALKTIPIDQWDFLFDATSGKETVQVDGRMNHVTWFQDGSVPNAALLNTNIHTKGLGMKGKFSWKDTLWNTENKQLNFGNLSGSDLAVSHLSPGLHRAVINDFPALETGVLMELTKSFQGSFDFSDFTLVYAGDHIESGKLTKGSVDFDWKFDNEASLILNGSIGEWDEDGIGSLEFSTKGKWSQKWQSFLNHHIAAINAMPLALRSQLKALDGREWQLDGGFSTIKWGENNSMPNDLHLKGVFDRWNLSVQGNDVLLGESDWKIGTYLVDFSGPLQTPIGRWLNQWLIETGQQEFVDKWGAAWESDGRVSFFSKGADFTWGKKKLFVKDGQIKGELDHQKWGELNWSGGLDALTHQSVNEFDLASSGKVNRDGVLWLMRTFTSMNEQAVEEVSPLVDHVKYDVKQHFGHLDWKKGLDFIDWNGQMEWISPNNHFIADGMSPKGYLGEEQTLSQAVLTFDGGFGREFQEWFFAHVMNEKQQGIFKDHLNDLTIAGRLDLSQLNTALASVLDHGEFQIDFNQLDGLGEFSGKWKMTGVGKEKIDSLVVTESRIDAKKAFTDLLVSWLKREEDHKEILEEGVKENEQVKKHPINEWAWLDEIHERVQFFNFSVENLVLKGLTKDVWSSASGKGVFSTLGLDWSIGGSMQGIRFDSGFDRMDVASFQLKAQEPWNQLLLSHFPDRIQIPMLKQLISKNLGQLTGRWSIESFDAQKIEKYDDIWLDLFDGELEWAHDWGLLTAHIHANGLNRVNNERLNMHVTWIGNDKNKDIDWSELGKWHWIGDFSSLLNGKKWTLNGNWADFNMNHSLLEKGTTEMMVQGEGIDASVVFTGEDLAPDFWKEASLEMRIKISDVFHQSFKNELEHWWQEKQLPMSADLLRLLERWGNSDQDSQWFGSAYVKGLDWQAQTIDQLIASTHEEINDSAKNYFNIVNAGLDGFEYMNLRFKHDQDEWFVVPMVMGWTISQWMEGVDMEEIRAQQDERILQFIDLALTKAEMDVTMKNGYRDNPHQLIVEGQGSIKGPLIDLSVLYNKDAISSGWMSIDGVLKSEFDAWEKFIVRNTPSTETLMDRIVLALPITFDVAVNAYGLTEDELKQMSISIDTGVGGKIRAEYTPMSQKVGLTEPKYWMPAVGEFYVQEYGQKCSLLDKIKMKRRWLKLMGELEMDKEPISLDDPEVKFQWDKIKEVLDECV